MAILYVVTLAFAAAVKLTFVLLSTKQRHNSILQWKLTID